MAGAKSQPMAFYFSVTNEISFEEFFFAKLHKKLHNQDLQQDNYSYI